MMEGNEENTAYLELAATKVAMDEALGATVQQALPMENNHPAMPKSGEPVEVLQLEGDWLELLRQFTKFKEVTVQTWHAGTCIEQVGSYDQLTAHNLLFNQMSNGQPGWDRGVLISYPDKEQFSLRFYQDGELMHHVLLSHQATPSRVKAIFHQFLSGVLPVSPNLSGSGLLAAPTTLVESHADFNTRLFEQSWSELASADDIDQLIRSTGVSREQAFITAGDAWASKVSARSFWERMKLLSEIKLPYRIVLNNGTMRHSLDGEVNRVQFDGRIIRYSGENFDFYLCYPEIASVWLVTLPEAEQLNSFIECHDFAGNLIARIESAAGTVESAVWQDIVSTIPALVA